MSFSFLDFTLSFNTEVASPSKFVAGCFLVVYIEVWIPEDEL